MPREPRALTREVALRTLLTCDGRGVQEKQRALDFLLKEAKAQGAAEALRGLLP